VVGLVMLCNVGRGGVSAGMTQVCLCEQEEGTPMTPGTEDSIIAGFLTAEGTSLPEDSPLRHMLAAFGTSTSA
jgi:hypothetical protein